MSDELQELIDAIEDVDGKVNGIMLDAACHKALPTLKALQSENAALREKINSVEWDRDGCMSALEKVSHERDGLQAKVDALMLEYCPNEMTPEQLENWGKHQKPVEEARKLIGEKDD